MGARVLCGGTNGFRHIGEFAAAIRAASGPSPVVDHRLRADAPGNTHQTAGGSGEGYLVPPQFRGEVWDAVFSDDESIDLLNLVDPEPTSSNAGELLADETTPWGSTGVQAYWRAEGSQMTPTKSSVEPRNVKLHELYAFVLAGDELLADAPRLRSRLTSKSALAIRWKASVALMRGTGAGQPLGWLGSPGSISVSPEIGQAAGTVVAANVAKMFSRMPAGAILEAVWLAHSDVLPQLVSMTIGSRPIWLPGPGIAGAPAGFLLGRPVLFSEHCSALGELGDLQFVAPGAGYYATTKQGEGLQFAESMHLFFDYGLQAFRWTFRLGGQPYLATPIAPAHGATTRSHFVALGARS